MNWLSITGITALCAFIVWLEWPKIDRKHRRDKISFIIITLLGWALAILLLFFPDWPGPIQWLDSLLQRIHDFLKL